MMMKRMMIGLMMLLMVVFGGCGNDKMIEIIRNDIAITNRYADGKLLMYNVHDEIRYASYAIYLMNQYGTTAVMESDDMYRNFLMAQNGGVFLTKNDLFNTYVFPDINRYGKLDLSKSCAIVAGTYYDAIDPTKDRKNAYTILNDPASIYDPRIWNIKRYKPTKAEKANPWFEKEIYVARYKNEFMTYEVFIENDKERGGLFYNFDESRVRITLKNGSVVVYKLNDEAYHNLIGLGYVNNIASNWYEKASAILDRKASAYDVFTLLESEFYNSGSNMLDVGTMLDGQVFNAAMGGN